MLEGRTLDTREDRPSTHHATVAKQKNYLRGGYRMATGTDCLNIRDKLRALQKGECR